mmetsp:Transcript_32003/g.23165  ORF Transcript_32003/g.23165 Transcript_32003/m.23165 type:complete len:119 (+) Transcript_32003:793-1149(+)
MSNVAIAGEFNIIKGFNLEPLGDTYKVYNPILEKGGEFVSYTICGLDRDGKEFEIARRYSEFEILRSTFVERYPGMYIPPIPSKKPIGNKKNETINTRCFCLNLFIKQLSRCPYLFES